jgi:hypothetical protein
VIRTEYSFLTHEEIISLVGGTGEATNLERELAQRLQAVLDMVQDEDDDNGDTRG